MTPVALFCLVSKPIPMRGVDERAARGQEADARDEEEADARGVGETESRFEEEALLAEGDGEDAPDRTEDGDAQRRVERIRSIESESSSAAEDFASLRRNRAFLVALAGYVAYTGTVGVYAAWGPKAGYGVYAHDLGSPSS